MKGNSSPFRCQSVLQHFILPQVPFLPSEESCCLWRLDMSWSALPAPPLFQFLPPWPCPWSWSSLWDPPGCTELWHPMAYSAKQFAANSQAFLFPTHRQQQPSIQQHLASQVEKSRLKTPKNQVEFLWMCCESSPWYWALNPFCLWLPSDVKWSLSQFLLLITGAGRFIPVNLQETNQEQPSVILTVSYSTNQTSLRSRSSLANMRDVSG